jgi:hypothetical protein
LIVFSMKSMNSALLTPGEARLVVVPFAIGR